MSTEKQKLSDDGENDTAVATADSNELLVVLQSVRTRATKHNKIQLPCELVVPRSAL